MATKQEAFIEKYKDVAQKESKRSGIPTSIILAQMIEESSWGTSWLAEKYNNFFGIKADKSWTGKTVTLPTQEEVNGKKITVLAKFRAYDDPYESLKDHGNFLLENPRYTKAGVFGKDAEGTAKALQSAGYATNSSYATNLLNIIKGRNLTQFDDVSKVELSKDDLFDKYIKGPAEELYGEDGAINDESLTEKVFGETVANKIFHKGAVFLIIVVIILVLVLFLWGAIKPSMTNLATKAV